MQEPSLLAVILQYFGIMTAVLTITLTVFGASSIPFIKDWISKIWYGVTYPFSGNTRKLNDLHKDHKNLSEKVDYIVEQLKPNSGSSLRDSLDRLEVTQLIHETKMSHYLDSKQAIMFETSAEGLYTWVSKGYEDLTGRSINDLRNWGWTLSIAAEDVALVRAEWYVAIEQKRIFEKTYKIKSLSGESIECYCRAIPTMLNNKVIAWVGILQPNGGFHGRG